jgi:hypothetical protein
VLKFYTPDRKGAQEPYSYRSRARLVGKCIEDLSNASTDDIVVLGRIHTEQDVACLRENNIRYIHDICDNKWPKLEKLWTNTNSTATAITTTCDELKQLVQTKTDKTVYVIPDPTERQREEPVWKPTGILRAVYYGSAGNLKQINWDNYDICTLDLKVISNEGPIMWSYETQGKYVNESDFVLLPVDNNNPMTMYKGNNRPVDALMQGKFVVTNAEIPSWLKLKDYIWCGDIDKGIKYVKYNPNQALERVRAGQQYVIENYSPNVISQQWQAVYEELA